jgi:hypothetical protein
MQKIKFTLIILVTALFISSCGGDHAAHNGKDTSKNSYQVPRDTSKADSTGADTNSMDNSGSGGTKIPKPDTGKHK